MSNDVRPLSHYEERELISELESRGIRVDSLPCTTSIDRTLNMLADLRPEIVFLRRVEYAFIKGEDPDVTDLQNAIRIMHICKDASARLLTGINELMRVRPDAG